MAGKLDENTSVPLRVVWIVGGAAVGGAAWLTTIFVYVTIARTDIAQAKSDIELIKKDRFEKREEYLRAISRVETKLDLVMERMRIPQPKEGQ